jgi:hypothetical protein
MHGVRLNYDHVSVKQWIGGSTCQYSAHRQAWVAARTLENLGVFLRSDILTRRAVRHWPIRSRAGSVRSRSASPESRSRGRADRDE